MSRYLRRAAGLVLVVLAATASSGAEPAEPLDQHGQAHVWRGASGQLTLLEFAASWCAPCRTTLPRLEAFAHRYPQLRVLTVSVDERREGRDRLVAALGLQLPMLWDAEHRIAEHYQPAAMPAAFLLAPDGEVLHVAVGSRREDWDEMVRRVDNQLRVGGR